MHVQCVGTMASMAPFTELNVNSVPKLGEMIAAVVSGGNHSCIVGRKQYTRCWGDNFYGQLDIKKYADKADIRKLSLGGEHTCMINNLLNIECFGSNRTGQLEIKNMIHQTNRKIVDLSTIENTTCVIDNQQLLTCKHQDKNVKIEQFGMDPRLLSSSKDVLCIIKSLVQEIPFDQLYCLNINTDKREQILVD